MTLFEAAYECKRSNPNNTVVRLCRKENDETLDFVELPGQWKFEQVILHNPVRAMWESRGESIDQNGSCYLACM